MHNGMGYRTEWEDVFCLAFGPTWRSLRDACLDVQAWRALRPQFVRTVCTLWTLPGPPCARAEEGPVAGPRDAKRVKSGSDNLENCPVSHGLNCPSTAFWRECNCLTCVVDCKPLAEVICGHAPLRDASLSPAFERATATLSNMFSDG